MQLGGPEASFRFGGHLAEDGAGRLYDKRAREQLRRVGLPGGERAIGAAEAVRAVSAAARMARYSGGRWAQKFGLSEVRLQVLLRIGGHPDQQLTLSQLADALDLSPRTVTGLVDLLERDRLVTRVPHARDRRVTLVRLTEAGRVKFEDAWCEVVGSHRLGFAEFSLEEMEQLRHLAYKLMISLGSGLD